MTRLKTPFFFLSLTLASACGGAEPAGPGAIDPGSTSDGGGDGGPDTQAIPEGALRVFITSTAYTGDLGGLEGGDAKCQLAADAAGLGGSFVAWLSMSFLGAGDDSFEIHAIDRVSGDGPWYRLDGQLAFSNRANLGTSPRVQINIDELGEEVGGETDIIPVVDEFGMTIGGNIIEGPRYVWTGTVAGGQSSPDAFHDCGSWGDETAGHGLIGSVGAAELNEWTEYGHDVLRTDDCDKPNRLYCFEQP